MHSLFVHELVIILVIVFRNIHIKKGPLSHSFKNGHLFNCSVIYYFAFNGVDLLPMDQMLLQRREKTRLFRQTSLKNHSKI